MDKVMQKSNVVLVVAIVEDDPRIQQLLLALRRLVSRHLLSKCQVL